MRLPFFVSQQDHQATIAAMRAENDATIATVRAEAVASVDAVRAESEASVARFMTEVAQAAQHGAYKLDYPAFFHQTAGSRRKPLQLIDATTLRMIADGIDPLRSAIEQIKREVRRQPIMIVPKDPKDRKAGTTATLARVTEAEEFFKRKGGNGGYGRWRTTFESEIIEDLLVLGAWSVYREWNRGGKFQQYAIDGATILPKVDEFGWDAETPYEQWVMGRKVRGFTPEEMVYDGVNARSHTPYFISPVEWLVSALTSYGKMDEWNRTWLTDGNAPGDDVFTLPEKLTPSQAREWVALFDELNAGNTRERRKVKFLPGDSSRLSAGTRKDQDFQEFEMSLVRRICSIYGVQAASIGYAGEQYKVSQEGSHDQTSQFGVGAVLLKRKELYDDTLDALGYDDLEMIDVEADQENALDRSNRHKTAVGKPWMTRNEARAEEGLDPMEGWDEEDTAPAPDPAELKPTKPAERAALTQWERVSLTRMGKGESPAYDFKTDALPEVVRALLLYRLNKADTEDAVRAVFADFSA